MKYSWEYTLCTGMHLLADAHGGMLLSTIPLAAFRLNQVAYQILKECEKSASLDVLIEKHCNIPQDSILRFLESFEKKGVIKRAYKSNMDTHDYPFVSVVIPVRNRPLEIQSCLESILACEYPKNRLEIVVVDDCSTDGATRDMIRSFPVRLLEMQQNVGQSRCRNEGVAAANGEIIAFTDSDCVVDRNWLGILTQPFVNPEVGVVGGGVNSLGRNKPLDRYEEVRSPLHMGDRSTEIAPNGLVPYVPTCNVLVRKRALMNVGGFSEEMRFGEDVDMIWRILQHGYKGWYIPEGRILHRHRNQILPFLKRRAQYATSEAVLEKKFIFNRKKLFFSQWNLMNLFIFLCGLLLFINFKQISTWIIALFILFGFLCSFSLELYSKRVKLRKLNFFPPFRSMAAAMYRCHLAFLGHLTAVLSRYYSLIILIVTVFLPQITPLLLGILGLSAYFEYMVKRPKINFLFFAGIYVLEMFCYQLGIFYGCFKEKQLTPMFHRIKII